MQVFLGKEEKVCNRDYREGGVNVPVSAGRSNGVLGTKLRLLTMDLGAADSLYRMPSTGQQIRNGDNVTKGKEREKEIVGGVVGRKRWREKRKGRGGGGDTRGGIGGWGRGEGGANAAPSSLLMVLIK